MTGIPLLIVFCLAIILMIVAISKFHIHPFLSLMGTSLVLAVVGTAAGEDPRHHWFGVLRCIFQHRYRHHFRGVDRAHPGEDRLPSALRMW